MKCAHFLSNLVQTSLCESIVAQLTKLLNGEKSCRTSLLHFVCISLHVLLGSFAVISR